MRVLIVAAVIALAAVTSWPACYSPDVADCQFLCGSDDACPGGTSCSGGFCRTRDAGTCGSGSGSDPCPAVQAGCAIVDDGAGSATTTSGGKFCFEECSGAVASTVAAASCSDGWHIAVFDTPAKLDAAKLLPATYWIGLGRATAAGTWSWITGTGTVSATDPNWSPAPNDGLTYTCAALDGGKYFSDACVTKHAFACSN